MPRRPLNLPFSGAALARERERAGLGLVGLVNRLADADYQVHRTTLGRIERGEHMPSPPLLRALTIALDVPLDRLLDGKPSRELAEIAERSRAIGA